VSTYYDSQHLKKFAEIAEGNQPMADMSSEKLVVVKE